MAAARVPFGVTVTPAGLVPTGTVNRFAENALLMARVAVSRSHTWPAGQDAEQFEHATIAGAQGVG